MREIGITGVGQSSIIGPSNQRWQKEEPPDRFSCMNEYTRPVINLEETIGKTVGKQRLPDPFDMRSSTKANSRAWHRAFPSKGYPKGVFRFKTHEEANAWTLQQMTTQAGT